MGTSLQTKRCTHVFNLGTCFMALLLHSRPEVVAIDQLATVNRRIVESIVCRNAQAKLPRHVLSVVDGEVYLGKLLLR